MQTITIVSRVRCVSIVRALFNADRIGTMRDKGRAAIVRWNESCVAAHKANGLLVAFDKGEALQARVATRHVWTHSMYAINAVAATANPRRYAPMLSAEDEKRVPSLNRKASVMRSRLGAVASAFDGADATDAGLAEVIRQWARIAGIQANGTDYSKPYTATGKNSSRFSECRGELANVRFLAHWREGFDADKLAKHKARNDLARQRNATPWLVDSEGQMRKPRILKDGSTVYGRDKVSEQTLKDRWIAAMREQIKADDAAMAPDVETATLLAVGKAEQRDTAREIAELAALIDAQKADDYAQSKGRMV